MILKLFNCQSINSKTLWDVLYKTILAPQVYSSKRYGIDMNKYPIIQSVNSELELLQPFRKAHAHRQPDTIAKFIED